MHPHGTAQVNRNFLFLLFLPPLLLPRAEDAGVPYSYDPGWQLRQPRGARGNPTPPYQTQYGAVAGTAQANGVNAFHSIPFARPPLGELRWKDPQPPESWEGVKDVSALAHECVQVNDDGDIPIVEGSEDCLYLYVYTSSAPQQTGGAGRKKGLKPVMLWIHGGGLQDGNGYLGGEDGPGGFYDGSNLAALFDVVVVSLQYRLNTFGFLASSMFPSENMTSVDGRPATGYGNFGFKDQRMGMQWVQDNIEYFGGDRRRVTLFGESAGGISMCYHLTSPASRGLFHRLIMESGSCYMQIQTKEAGEAMAKSLTNRTGCLKGTVEETKNCMQTALHIDLAYPLGNEKGPLNGSEYWVAPSFPWCMTVDGTLEGLVDPPHIMLRNGNFSRVPVIFGSNTNEFQCDCDREDLDKDCLFAVTIPAILPQLNPPYSDEDLRTILNHFLNVTLTDEEFISILDHYPSAEFEGNNTARLSAILVDTPGWIGSCETQLSAQDILVHNHKDVWVYHFARLGEMRRVGHFSEVAYVFNNCAACGTANSSDCCQGTYNSTSDMILSYHMGRFWTNLGRYGNPNGFFRSVWPRYTRLQQGPIMELNVPMKLRLGYRTRFCNFWNKILENRTRVIQKKIPSEK